MWYNRRRGSRQSSVHKRAKEYLKSIKGRPIWKNDHAGEGESKEQPKLPELQHDPYSRFQKTAAERDKPRHDKGEEDPDVDRARYEVGQSNNTTHHHHHHNKSESSHEPKPKD